MANHKIQLKNKAGDNLFPLTRKGLISDFNHTHSFTPKGTITLSRSADTALSTTTISSITGVGSLPTRTSFTYNTITVSGTTLYINDASAYQITGVGSLPTTSSVTVATGISTQPTFTGTFSGTSSDVGDVK